MPQSLVTFFETLYYAPRWYHWGVAIALLPLSLLYGSIMWVRRRIARPVNLGVPVVSVGNLVVGGSGKTPMAIALASRFGKPAIVSRGYGRKSLGLVLVSAWGRIEASVEEAGDEAMVMAKSLPHATVIVSEDRVAGIERAKAMGAEVVFLDDGFSKVGIEKFDLLLCPPHLPNPLPLPSGPFREFAFERRRADRVVVEGRDFRRVVVCEGCDGEPLMLLTAIARPERLEPYLPGNVVGRLTLPDHAWFDEERVREAMKRCGAEKLLVTEKDLVKLEEWPLEKAVLRLNLDLEESVAGDVEAYVRGRV
ncbi:tetraacyldisaccharide 4'-kinase [Hydrogenimonas sp.]